MQSVAQITGSGVRRAKAAQGVRAEVPGLSLADIYDSLTIPPVLVRAHHKLDATVDAAYGEPNWRSDAELICTRPTSREPLGLRQMA